jgi:uncharacterized protein (DUF1800 family)
MRDDQPPSGTEWTPWPSEVSAGGDSWDAEPWIRSDAGAMPMAPGPDTTPTRILPGSLPSWAQSESGGPRKGMSRRTVLAGAAAGAVGLGAAGAGLGFWLSHHQGGLGDMAAPGQLMHLLRRAGFGARPDEVADYTALGVSGAVDQLLNPALVTDDLDANLAKLNLDLANNPLDMQRWFILRMIYSKRQLEEKMTLFWHGVLTSSYREVGGKRGYAYIIPQNQLLRAHGLGRFDDLIRAVTLDPAMMWYLDLRVSTARAPNENYARELMELFTMGLTDPQGHPNYTQNDVAAGARALTGWAIENGKAAFIPGRHDSGAKTYLGHSGNLGLDDVVNIVCAHPATSYHIAWRMWSFFAYATTPDDSVLQPLVDAYHQQNHSTAAMMRALLTSPAFYSDKAYRQRVKSPAEFVVGAIRALELRVNGQGLPQVLAAMGQEMLNPPNVSGWDGDKDSATWISTQAWMTRVNFVNSLLAVASGAATPAGHAQAGATAATSGSALQALIDAQQIATPSSLVDFFVGALLDNQLAADRRATVADYLTQATQASAAGPSLLLHGGAKMPAAAVRGALYLLFSLPEYQLN